MSIAFGSGFKGKPIAPTVTNDGIPLYDVNISTGMPVVKEAPDFGGKKAPPFGKEDADKPDSDGADESSDSKDEKSDKPAFLQKESAYPFGDSRNREIPAVSEKSTSQERRVK